MGRSFSVTEVSRCSPDPAQTAPREWRRAVPTSRGERPSTSPTAPVSTASLPPGGGSTAGPRLTSSVHGGPTPSSRPTPVPGVPISPLTRTSSPVPPDSPLCLPGSPVRVMSSGQCGRGCPGRASGVWESTVTCFRGNPPATPKTQTNFQRNRRKKRTKV